MKFLCVFLVGFAMFAGGDAAKGKALYQVCVACHGANGEGNQVLNSPNLTGLPDWYLKKQIQNYKNGIRGKHPEDIYGMQMAPMVATLANEQAIDDVVAYILTLKGGPVKHTEKGDAAKGKTFYATCIACHGQKGEGMKALNSPPINGQPDWYLIRQLQNYKKGIRGKHPKDIYGMQMAPMAMTLPDDQAIKDVVEYIKSL